MKTILFTYETPLGTFWIRPEPADRVQLGLDRSKLRTYGSAKAAARAVAEQSTGHDPWDSAVGFVIPNGLEKWKRPPKPREVKATRPSKPDLAEE
jgi:hypothetical protein